MRLRNALLRAGIVAMLRFASLAQTHKVIARPLGLKPGYYPGKFNQLVDELEVEAFLNKQPIRWFYFRYSVSGVGTLVFTHIFLEMIKPRQ
jgi:hypothetical protein